MAITSGRRCQIRCWSTKDVECLSPCLMYIQRFGDGWRIGFSVFTTKICLYANHIEPVVYLPDKYKQRKVSDRMQTKRHRCWRQWIRCIRVYCIYDGISESNVTASIMMWSICIDLYWLAFLSLIFVLLRTHWMFNIKCMVGFIHVAVRLEQYK